MGLWVDTDFGFDDLWALLVLRSFSVDVDGVSLVAGNSPLDQVCRNAFGARQVFDFQWPIHSGAARPLKRAPETAERILGPLGMASRGAHVPQNITPTASIGAQDALCEWLATGQTHEVLALGPLTNMAELFTQHPELARRISRITWMGGSQGRGNHTEFAEFNAVADAEALELLVNRGAPLRIVDLEICRRVTFAESAVEQFNGLKGKLLSDLLGGYLDIALSRGRDVMAIYDPVAALAVCGNADMGFENACMTVTTEQSQEYGQTLFDFSAPMNVEVATEIDAQTATGLCLSALTKEAHHV